MHASGANMPCFDMDVKRVSSKMVKSHIRYSSLIAVNGTFVAMWIVSHKNEADAKVKMAY